MAVIKMISLSSLMLTGGIILDHTANNWFKWWEYIEKSLKMCLAWGYLTGRVPVPNVESDPVSAYNYSCNEEVIVVFLRMKALREEQQFMGSYDKPADLWGSLCARHQKELGVYT
ncbi:hypothetical protein FOMPIDRAFT_92640 [Fomitopsis schrenkii]|uniref:Uncharacterized protein n=1 Tax=Fomitopsis schrenkii TaxID=2126942 RepID=S8DJP0_FOMSC|nr:hypothetical protein FOMPIDRAFT_92640 [Fomitopsis schrenkii]